MHSCLGSLPSLRPTSTFAILPEEKFALFTTADPRLLPSTRHQSNLKSQLNKRTKNHLNSMYFGALSVGADITSGFLAMMHVKKTQQPIQLVFKDFKANFIKRAEARCSFLLPRRRCIS